MKITEMQLPESGLFDALFPRLNGRVFHGTNESIHQILHCDEIRPNQHGLHSGYYGSFTNSFFKKRGCVSFFDYRSTDTEQFEQFCWRCRPTNHAKPGAVLAYLFLSPSAYSDLILWTLWKTEGEPPEMILPYLEVGHPGPITLDKIEEIILVLVTQNPMERRQGESARVAVVRGLLENNTNPPPPEEDITAEMLNDPFIGEFWQNAWVYRRRLERRWKRAQQIEEYLRKHYLPNHDHLPV
jgi:hypothetical protein